MSPVARAILLSLLLSAPAISAGPDAVRPSPVAEPVATRPVDLCICLDTSGSMDGLIDSARQKLWAIVNELALARPRADLRVALYQYGNDGLSPENGWVQQITPLTDNLDEVYEKLFALRTNGGREYVARVTRAAVRQLDWSEDGRALRIIVVAGNEAATQDPEIKLADACGEAAGAGIIVNTIFCGPEQEGRNTGWADAARWADGRFAAIDQQGGTVTIQTPYDDELARLGEQLNETYVHYGAGGRRGKARQEAQDANALSLGAPAAAQRAAAKASGLYHNAGWDLVDAVEDGDVDLAEVDKEDLPEEMQAMSADERKAFVTEQARKREAIRQRIRELNEKRDEHRRREMTRRGLAEKDAFDAALRQAIREQAARNGFVFPQREAPKGE